MTPQYFHERLTIHEAEDFIKGLDFRYRHGYVESRLIADVIVSVFTKKKGTGIVFDFEKEEEARRHAAPDEKELETIRKISRMLEKR
ncbi:MAG: hypothetical protein LUD72_07140 [Bacteroidales bacterium]|nr:hypothetical protein [Bacteroidales bacterium]